MSRRICALLLASVGTLFLAVGVMYAGSTRVLTGEELTSLRGGGITFCQSAAGSFRKGDTCHVNGSFDCTNVCNVCSGKPQATCQSVFCWRCAQGNIKECLVGGGPGCTDMGSAVNPCGLEWNLLCSWNSLSSACECKETNMQAAATTCTRRDCK